MGMQQLRLFHWVLLFALPWLMASTVVQAEVPEIEQIQIRMNAIAELGEKAQKEHKALLEAMMEQAEQLAAKHPHEPRALVWQAVVYEQYANFHGGFNGLKLAKQAREKLEEAIEIDAQGEDGLAYLTLGLLYERTPGWPVAFGRISTADDMYLKALTIRPESADTNYQYARFLRGIERKDEAFTYAQKAIEATPRQTLAAFDASLQQKAKALVGIK